MTQEPTENARSYSQAEKDGIIDHLPKIVTMTMDGIKAGDSPPVVLQRLTERIPLPPEVTGDVFRAVVLALKVVHDKPELRQSPGGLEPELKQQGIEPFLAAAVAGVFLRAQSRRWFGCAGLLGLGLLASGAIAALSRHLTGVMA